MALDLLDATNLFKIPRRYRYYTEQVLCSWISIPLYSQTKWNTSNTLWHSLWQLCRRNRWNENASLLFIRRHSECGLENGNNRRRFTHKCFFFVLSCSIIYHFFGIALRIHITSDMNDALTAIGGFKTEPRGLIEVKGKGLMNTFWLTCRDGAPALSVTDEIAWFADIQPVFFRYWTTHEERKKFNFLCKALC